MDGNFELMDKIVESKNISHSFLLSVDDNYETSFSINFVKKILSTFIVDKKKLQAVFNDIDNNCCADLKIIEPDGKFIKKEQLIELMNDYKNLSVNDNKRFYIIEYAEDLNASSANTILKFLEEPESNIIAILVTKKLYSVLDTIVSRCQIINFNKYYKNKYDIDDFRLAVNFLYDIEKYGKAAIAYMSDLYLFKSEQLSFMFDIWLLIYEDYISYNFSSDHATFNFDIYSYDKFLKLFDLIDKKSVVNKINKIEYMKTLLGFNVNVRIILDLLLLGGDCNEI